MNESKKVKIVTENLKPFSRTFEKVRVPKTAYYGSVYLDFKNESLIFQNTNSFIKIPLNIDLPQEANLENVFIFDGDKFFILVNQYDELFFDGETFTTFDNNEFKLSLFKEDFSQPEFNSSEWEVNNISIDYSFLSSLRRAMSYINPDMDSLNGVFIDSGKLLAIQPTKLYQEKLSWKNNFNLPYSFLKVLMSFDCLGESKIYTQTFGDSKRYFFERDDISIRFVTSDDLRLPTPIGTEAFESTYNHETYFTCDRNSFLAALKFLSPFVKDVTNNIIRITFVPEEDKINLLVEDTENIIKYSVEGIGFSSKEAFNDSFLFSFSSLVEIFSQIGEETIYITFDAEKPAMKFWGNSDFFIVHTKVNG